MDEGKVLKLKAGRDANVGKVVMGDETTNELGDVDIAQAMQDPSIMA